MLLKNAVKLLVFCKQLIGLSGRFFGAFFNIEKKHPVSFFLQYYMYINKTKLEFIGMFSLVKIFNLTRTLGQP